MEAKDIQLVYQISGQIDDSFSNMIIQLLENKSVVFDSLVSDPDQQRDRLNYKMDYFYKPYETGNSLRIPEVFDKVHKT